VLFPVHDQVYLLSRFQDRFRGLAGLAVPEFAALQRLQSKAVFLRLLDELNLAHPPTILVRTGSQLQKARAYPYYIKLSYSTAGCGVWLVRNADERDAVLKRLQAAGLLDGNTDILVQQAAPGVLGVVQAVFQRGRLVGGHCYQARALGVGGSARARVGTRHPGVLEESARLGAHLHWHGALTLDYLWDETNHQARYIDANPRIGETLNATLSGVNLSDLLVQVSLNQTVDAPLTWRPGVRTHGLFMGLLFLAQQGATRRQLLAELYRAVRGRDIYAESQDELTRASDDPQSLIPFLFLVSELLLRPRAASARITRTVENYALSESAVRRIRTLSPYVSEPDRTD
jgi:predicted ATP-grasp superfamily ATP-dependent carboligase